MEKLFANFVKLFTFFLGNKQQVQAINNKVSPHVHVVTLL